MRTAAAARTRPRCRPLVRVVAIALIAAMTLALTACGGGTTKAVVFGEADLPHLLLQPSDAQGLDYSEEASKEVEANWTEGGDERLKALGLQGARFALFESADYGEADVTSGALRFGDSDGASRALDYLSEELKEPIFSGELATNIAADGLGDESWGLKSADGILYGFRVGNAVILLIALGDVDARGLAEKVAERVAGAAR